MKKTMTTAEEMSEENKLDVEINQAYINIVGAEYANANEAEEAYQGEFNSDENFAQYIAEELGLLTKAELWPYNCVDWEFAAKELMMDYSEDEGHYFRNL